MTNKIRQQIARLHKHIMNQRLDTMHKLSTKIVMCNDIICIEDLKVKNMVKNHNLARSVSDVSWSEFARQLEYKAKWHGKTVIKVDMWYPSSQICHICGHRNPDIKNLLIREWDCPCCYVHHDRDINAAINILNEGLRIYYEQLAV